MTIPVRAEALATTPQTSNRVPEILQTFRQSRRYQWIGKPPVYACSTFLLTILGSGVMLMAPRLLDPAAFGTFALLTSLFIYAGRADFGLSQLADKEIPGQHHAQALETGLDILNALWLVGFGLLVIILPLIALLGGNFLPRLDTALAITGGIMAMVANGPVTLARASTRLWDFTVIALVLQFGMTIPRLVGLLSGGITGTFAALAAYYVLCALLFARPSFRHRRPLPLLGMARLALPLFAFNALWIFYLGANRWISALLSSPHDLGLFSLAASLAMIGLGLMSTIAQTRYPKLLIQIRNDAASCSLAIEKELLFVTATMAGVAVVAVFAAKPTLEFLFIGYEEGVASTIALATACIPLGAMTWIVPMLIVRSQRPIADALLVAVAGLVALGIAMSCGDAIAGLTGQAWGNVLACLVMLTFMIRLMNRLGMVAHRSALRILSIQVFASVFAAALAWTYPARSEPDSSVQSLVDPSGWTTTFEDDFTSLDLQSGSMGTWEPYYPNGGRSNAGNKELQYYVDPRPGGDGFDVQALEPYRVHNGVLEIRGNSVPERLRPQSGGYRYASGLLNSAGRFSFQYGSVQVRAKVPHGRGLWPAVWLLPQDRTWPPELDVLEVLGHDTSTVHMTAHSGLAIPAGERSARTGTRIRTVDLSEDFHVYGLTWTRTKLIWSLDGKAVFAAATPRDMHKPMFLLINLAVGGDWPGSPDADTSFPATFSVDWIRVRQPINEGIREQME